MNSTELVPAADPRGVMGIDWGIKQAPYTSLQPVGRTAERYSSLYVVDL